jgi:oligoribonuclease NrnB/cAMP/cGMP phosphodiesterase (DHH superfamily)
VYHSADLDGKMSAAIVRSKLPDALLVPWNYGDDIPDFAEDAQLYFVDVCFPMDKMIELAKNHPVVLLDHHKTVLEHPRFPELAAIANCTLCAIGQAGCELTWTAFYEGTNAPFVVRCLGRYDVWDKSFSKGKVTWEDLCCLQLVMRHATVNDLRLALHDNEEETTERMKEGRSISDYVTCQREEMAERYAYVIKIDGIQCACMNSAERGSKVIEHYAEEHKCPLMFVYTHTKQKFFCSFYSTDTSIDCSDIAKRYGGGGHKGAAGCEMTISQFLDVTRRTT